MADVALDRDILQRIARYRRRRKARLLFLIAPVMLETVALAILPIVWSQVHGGPFFMGLQPGTRADWALWSIFMALTVLPLGFLLKRSAAPRLRVLSTLLRWGPLVIGAVRGLAASRPRPARV